MKFQMGFKPTSDISTDLYLEIKGFFLFSFEKFSCSLGWSYTHYNAKDDLEYPIVLSLLPECWGFRHEPENHVQFYAFVQCYGLNPGPCMC